MKRIAAYLASAALGAGLVGSGPAWAQMRSDMTWRYPYNSDNYAYNYGYPYNYAYGYGYGEDVKTSKFPPGSDESTGL